MRSPRASRSRTLRLRVLLTAWISLSACEQKPAPPSELLVFAAASLRDVLGELTPGYEKQHRTKIVYNFAGSAELVHQIEATHKADVFLSASETWMDQLEKDHLVAAGSRQTFLSNRLVIVANAADAFALTNPKDLAHLPFSVLSMGDPAAVPAGQYAQTYLESLNDGEASVWDRVKDRVAPASNVRAALALVDAKPGTLGIVYRTDLTAAHRVRVLYEVPEAAGPPIAYAAAAMSGRNQLPEATSFLAYLTSDEARATFERSGFVTVAKKPSP